MTAEDLAAIIQLGTRIDSELPVSDTHPGAIVGPPSREFSFPITLATPAQLKQQKPSSTRPPVHWLILCESTNWQQYASNSYARHISSTRLSEAEVRQQLFTHFPHWFIHGSSLHATVISKNNLGIMLRGQPGSGKSRLMHELVSKHNFKLVADDAPDLYRTNANTLLAACPPSIYTRFINKQGKPDKIPAEQCVWHCKLQMSIYLEAKNIQNRPDAKLDVCRHTKILGIFVPEWVLQPDTIQSRAHKTLKLAQEYAKPYP